LGKEVYRPLVKFIKTAQTHVKFNFSGELMRQDAFLQQPTPVSPSPGACIPAMVNFGHA